MVSHGTKSSTCHLLSTCQVPVPLLSAVEESKARKFLAQSHRDDKWYYHVMDLDSLVQNPPNQSIKKSYMSISRFVKWNI
jgi:hypothetical protein